MKTEVKQLTAIDIANYFLVLVNREEGDAITHLKLQKLLYFAQGASLVLLNKPLFNEPLKAWPYGPVSQSVFNQFKVFNHNAIPLPGEIDFTIYDTEIKALIYRVYSTCGEHTAWYLSNLSHTHKGWQEACKTDEKVLDEKEIKKDCTVLFEKETLKLSKEEIDVIETAEDEWWMNYNTGEPSEDITEYLLSSLALAKEDPEKYASTLTTIDLKK